MHTKQLTKTEEDITTIDCGKVEVSKSNGMDFSYDNNKTFKLGHKGVTARTLRDIGTIYCNQSDCLRSI